MCKFPFAFGGGITIAYVSSVSFSRDSATIFRGWNAPDAPWAVALALAACARGKQEGFKLGNPGVLTELYPPFWVLYNNLPEPHMARENKEVPAEPVKSRRRVITSAVAVPPPLEDEDY